MGCMRRSAVSSLPRSRRRDALLQLALDGGGRDNITVIVVDMRSDMPCDEDWNVSKIGDDEDIDDALDGTLQTLRVIQ